MIIKQKLYSGSDNRSGMILVSRGVGGGGVVGGWRGVCGWNVFHPNTRPPSPGPSPRHRPQAQAPGPRPQAKAPGRGTGPRPQAPAPGTDPRPQAPGHRPRPRAQAVGSYCGHLLWALGGRRPGKERAQGEDTP